MVLVFMSGKGCSSSMSGSSILQARRAVEQLRLEASMERMKISIAAAQLLQYCEEHSCSDPLLTGIAASANPFKDKKSCVLL